MKTLTLWAPVVFSTIDLSIATKACSSTVERRPACLLTPPNAHFHRGELHEQVRTIELSRAKNIDLKFLSGHSRI
jgi:hypothetical protein